MNTNEVTNCNVFDVSTDELGNVTYYKNDQIYRKDGPAIIRHDGTKEWIMNYMRHREDGPAIECPDGRKGWYLDDVEYSEEEFNKKIAEPRKDVFATFATKKPDGIISSRYYKNRELHREDGPAVDDGDTQEYYLEGILYTKEDYKKLTSK